jgi:hypothetical protein
VDHFYVYNSMRSEDVSHHHHSKGERSTKNSATSSSSSSTASAQRISPLWLDRLLRLVTSSATSSEISIEAFPKYIIASQGNQSKSSSPNEIKNTAASQPRIGYIHPTLFSDQCAQQARLDGYKVLIMVCKIFLLSH